MDVQPTAALLFEVGWAIVRPELDGTSDLPLEAALRALDEIVGLGLIARD